MAHSTAGRIQLAPRQQRLSNAPLYARTFTQHAQLPSPPCITPHVHIHKYTHRHTIYVHARTHRWSYSVTATLEQALQVKARTHANREQEYYQQLWLPLSLLRHHLLHVSTGQMVHGREFSPNGQNHGFHRPAAHGSCDSIRKFIRKGTGSIVILRQRDIR